MLAFSLFYLQIITFLWRYWNLIIFQGNRIIIIAALECVIYVIAIPVIPPGLPCRNH